MDTRIKRTIKLAGGSGLALLSLLALPCQQITAQAADTRPEGEQLETARPVPTARARLYSARKSFCFPGKVRAASQTELSFQIAGKIAELEVLEGQKVREGEILATLERKNRLLAVEAARANYLATKEDFQRAKQLYQEKVVSKARFDTAQSVHDVARAKLAMKEKDLADTRLLAPFDALIAKRFVERKEHVKKGEAVVLLLGGSGLEVEVELPETLVAKGALEILDGIEISFDADPGRKFAARPLELSLSSNAETRTYTLITGLSSPAEMQILPGMTATVTGFINEQRQKEVEAGAVLVPVEAIFFSPDTTAHVWVIDPISQRATKKMVEPGPMLGDEILIVKGLAKDELVAVAGLQSINEAMPIRPMKEDKKGLEG